ncbi:MAG: hypothetical protein JNL98_04910 [Bryobacterales bacterium]|nr:hypothetical protein [Bryobacterales bacterium]
MYEFTFYTFCDREYFEPLGRYPIGRTYLDSLKELLPPGWGVSRSDVWLQATPEGAKIRPQGFKIHLASAVSTGRTMLQRFVPVCVSTRTPFKIAADPTLHLFLNSKRYPRGGAGKFATIYPSSDESFRELLDLLDEATRGFSGPYVLSDRRYKNSKTVFYRYGGLQRMEELRVDGTRRMMIQAPDGAWEPDTRTPFFQLPLWVEDPVAGPSEAVADDTADTLLNGRYEVTEALNFTNTGGVYRATDHRTGREVVIKEARPHTILWASGHHAIDALTALRHEQTCLRELQGLPFVPELIDSFEEWENTFLVASYFDGVPLARLRAMEEFILLTRIDDEEQVERFSNIWKNVCLQVLDAVDAFHQRGVILGDISPGNVLMNRDTGQLVFIDFESAQCSAGESQLSDFAVQWFNPGFRRVERRSEQALDPSDDYFACGMLLYNLLCPIQTMFELDRKHPTGRVLDYFIEAGVPEEIRRIIHALFEGRPEEARRLCREWNPETRRTQRAFAAAS